MPLFTGSGVQSYARRHMPLPKRGGGPWGEAIRFWLDKRQIQQADVVRATGLRANTVSRATRGFHTTTRVLERIATALHAPIDQVLVSPVRKLANEERRALASEISEEVLRSIDERAGTVSETAEATAAAATQVVDKAEQDLLTPKKKPSTGKKRRRHS